MLKESEDMGDAFEGTEGLAKFFGNSTANFNKAKLGEWLGDDKAEHVEVLQCFAMNFPFAAVDFEPALRKYLCGFRLPGEA